LEALVSKRILLVDDSEPMARLVKIHLEQDGHAVTSVHSATAAMAAFDTGEKFDLYIFDVHLGAREPHGLFLANMLELKNPKARIIFITAEPSMVRRPELAGRAAFPKPLDFAALRTAVAGRFRNRRR
jgi:DNA-binding response OmpR family regulator